MVCRKGISTAGRVAHDVGGLGYPVTQLFLSGFRHKLDSAELDSAACLSRG